MTDSRISRDSSRLISSLDSDSRYIKFVKSANDSFAAVICSQVTDEPLSDILAGDDKEWTFSDRSKAVRSIRRLNKNIQIYQGTISFDHLFSNSKNVNMTTN